MRQWNINPKYMCKKHLLGEHLETHMFVGTINQGKKVHGYIKGNLLEPFTLISRHDELVEEIKRRGMNHYSPINYNVSYIANELQNSGHTEGEIKHKIDKDESLKELITRCSRCKARFENEKKNKNR